MGLHEPGLLSVSVRRLRGMSVDMVVERNSLPGSHGSFPKPGARI